MKEYTHPPLQATNNTRLVTILPGEFKNDVLVDISEVSLDQIRPRGADQRRTPRLSIGQLKTTLPPGWDAFKTKDGQVLFVHWDSKGGVLKTSWMHPDDTTPPSSYQSSAPEAQVATIKYEALSYTWGPPDDVEFDIFIVDRSSSSPTEDRLRLRVRQNLARALRQLRHKDRERTLWIDAICINQNDLDERSSQVARMPQIYQLAEHVTVWLGPATDNSGFAMRQLEYLARQVQIVFRYHAFYFLPAPEAKEKGWSTSNSLLFGESSETRENTWHAIAQLLSREWFYRVWVQQEIHLAREARVYCGEVEVDWKDFSSALIVLSNNDLRPHKILPRTRLEVPSGIARTYGAVWTIDQLFTMLARGRSCTDPRDFVYGFLGLLPLQFSRKIPLRYDLPVREVYRATAITYVNHLQRLELLANCCLETRTRQDLPSWVPDFSSPGLKALPNQFASGYSRCDIEQSPFNDNSITVIGLRCATIKSVKKPIRTDIWALQDVLDLAREEISSPRTYCTGESFRTTFTKTITLGETSENSAAFRYWHAIDQQKGFPYAFEVKAASFPPYALERLQGRQYLTTNEGYIGFGPPGVQAGDIICIFLGLDKPIVLRPLLGSYPAPAYAIVGACFVHGLQHGAALLGPLPKAWVVRASHERLNSARVEFHNTETNTSHDDPRLEPISSVAGGHWEFRQSTRSSNDALYFRTYKHCTTGEVIKYDPRMTPEALSKRGVELEEFVLV
ncbi:heterokaryon incompatibility protein-domain-containing protein [Podospora australis]|uniref:Heterokaryon incompatibility protein-domain-containing protein n=1 Tax=Podospora australis TaxID=1536484 RepID=A0AAN7AGW5_9PEZI|nr:heterokaryon incompatibility protein-domain-containing protein [Podospora australis]